MRRSSPASTLNDTNQEHDDRDDQEGVNESAQGVRADKPQEPQDDQDDGNGSQHFGSPHSITWWLENEAAHATAIPATFGLRAAR